MGLVGVWQIAIIAVIVLLLFGGAGKITRLMGDVGSGLRAFKKGIADDGKEADPDEHPKAVNRDQVETPAEAVTKKTEKSSEN